MWRNLLPQALYQITVLLILQFRGKAIFGVSDMVRNTLIFNTFVLCQIFNEFNARNQEKKNVFKGIHTNKLFMGDPGRFRQIITNLVGNSIKFTERGHIFVKVHLAEPSMAINGKSTTYLKGGSDEGVKTSVGRQFRTLSGCEAADDQNSWENFKLLIAYDKHRTDFPSNVADTDEVSEYVTLMVSVEDTGIGIPLSAQERVFMPFMQTDSSTSRHYGGTGIGLSISKCLGKLMGGQIKFTSRPHVGSTFTFTANFGRCKEDAVRDLKKPNSEELPLNFKGLRVILVDGKLVRATVTKFHLRRLGILVDVVSSIKMAVAFCGKNGSATSRNIVPPDIILVDKDAWSSGEKFDFNIQKLEPKQNGYTYKLPKTMLLATNFGTGEFDKAKAAGFTNTMTMKPLRASMVAACLQQVLGIGKKRQEGKELPNGSHFLQSLLSGKKILVVDDNMVNRRVAAGALKKFKADVVCVDSGKAALQLLQIPHKFDACFMDIQMPEMDGFEATRRIRQMESEANGEMKGGYEGMARKSEWHLPVLAIKLQVNAFENYATSLLKQKESLTVCTKGMSGSHVQYHEHENSELWTIPFQGRGDDPITECMEG